MDLVLRRVLFDKLGIVGEIQADNGAFSCFTLEHGYEDQGEVNAKVPTGLYLCVKGTHRLHSSPEEFDTFEVTGVSNHSGILFHPGNFSSQSQGCILLGESWSTDVNGRLEILNSRATFKRFMAFQGQADSFVLLISDASFSEMGNA